MVRLKIRCWNLVEFVEKFRRGNTQQSLIWVRIKRKRVAAAAAAIQKVRVTDAVIIADIPNQKVDGIITRNLAHRSTSHIQSQWNLKKSVKVFIEYILRIRRKRKRKCANPRLNPGVLSRVIENDGNFEVEAENLKRLTPPQTAPESKLANRKKVIPHLYRFVTNPIKILFVKKPVPRKMGKETEKTKSQLLIPFRNPNMIKSWLKLRA